MRHNKSKIYCFKAILIKDILENVLFQKTSVPKWLAEWLKMTEVFQLVKRSKCLWIIELKSEICIMLQNICRQIKSSNAWYHKEIYVTNVTSTDIRFRNVKITYVIYGEEDWANSRPLRDTSKFAGMHDTSGKKKLPAQQWEIYINGIYQL